MSGSWVLDSEALSQLLRDERDMVVRLAVARKRDIRVVACAATVIDADHDGVHPARLSWVLSRLTVHAVTKDSALTASRLLKEAGLHGHEYAIDAMVVTAALELPDRPVDILTPDPDDLSVLLGGRLEAAERKRDRDRSKVRVIRV
ncbi:DNA-binding protein [Streptomyces sp. HPF1205]|uniref:DNA-binding protein n=1 Tax=Streptomyces sp. HPF1205 TaxID=2873262 RepID=UPI001CEDB60C|nr:DNA-binding protein [Streptomyces sp. HPF1205]